MAEIPSSLSDRGLRHWEPVMTDYGHPVKVYESSAAKGPHCWLAIDPSEEPGCENIVGHAHLTYVQAVEIRDRLTAWIEEVPERWGIDPAVAQAVQSMSPEERAVFTEREE